MAKFPRNPVSGMDNSGNRRGETPANSRGGSDKVATYTLKNEGTSNSPGGSSKKH